MLGHHISPNAGFYPPTLQAVSPPLNVDPLVLQHITQMMKLKVKDAAEDKKFTPNEIVTLTMASVHAVEQVFPYLQGTEKKQIATNIVQTVITQLVAEGVLTSELGQALEMLPISEIIDVVVSLMNRLGGWLHRKWPTWWSWMRLHFFCCCVPRAPRSDTFKPKYNLTTPSPIANPSSLNSVKVQQLNAILDRLNVVSIEANCTRP